MLMSNGRFCQLKSVCQPSWSSVQGARFGKNRKRRVYVWYFPVIAQEIVCAVFRYLISYRPMPRMLGMFHLWFTPFTAHSLCHITPGRLCWNLGIPLCTDCSKRTWKSENRQMLSTSHLQLLIKSVLNWIQVTSELPVLILNKFRNVINPPYCLDMLWHLSVVPTASVSLHCLHISPFFW